MQYRHKKHTKEPSASSLPENSMVYHTQNTKYKAQRKILRAARGKPQIMYKGKPNRITSAFSNKNSENQKNTTLHILKSMSTKLDY